MENEAGKKRRAENTPWGWIIYFVVMILFNLIWILPPIMMDMGHEELAMPIYYGLSFTCHQLDSRSLCYFPDTDGPIRECAPQGGEQNTYQRTIDHIDDQGNHGFKFGVCSRDNAIYMMMLIGALIWPIFYRFDEDRWPPTVWLILALIPAAIDGGTQLIGLRESTNLLRLLTGGVMGLGMSFYIIPTLNQILNPRKKK